LVEILLFNFSDKKKKKNLDWQLMNYVSQALGQVQIAFASLKLSA